MFAAMFRLAGLSAVLLLTFTACGKTSDTPDPTPRPRRVVPARPDEPALLDPALATKTAPEKFKARFETNRGDFVVEVHRIWAKRGADRFYNLVKIGFYDDVCVFRVEPKWVVQWGLKGIPTVDAAWLPAAIKDDVDRQDNGIGYVTFANSGPNSRGTQIFVNVVDNSTKLSKRRFAPFGKVVDGMDVVRSFYAGYESSPPNQQKIRTDGNDYLAREFPELDWIHRATIIDG